MALPFAARAISNWPRRSRPSRQLPRPTFGPSPRTKLATCTQRLDLPREFTASPPTANPRLFSSRRNFRYRRWPSIKMARSLPPPIRTARCIASNTAQPKPNASKDKTTVDPSWSSSVYFDPGTKYIWDLELDDNGTLYIATGDTGEIFRVTPKGEHSVFFKSDEAHIRVLARDSKGNLIAGSDGSGLVYRISPSGEGFVLYSAAKKEITALAIDATGNIYAAGVGEKRASAAPQILPVTPAPTAPTSNCSSRTRATDHHHHDHCCFAARCKHFDARHD